MSQLYWRLFKIRELCAEDIGFGLGAKILSIVNKEPLFVVVDTEGTRCLVPLYTGLKPSPKKTFPKKCDGTITSSLCWDVSTIFKWSSGKSPSHQSRSPVSRLKDASVFSLFFLQNTISLKPSLDLCWLTDNRRQRWIATPPSSFTIGVYPWLPANPNALLQWESFRCKLWGEFQRIFG